MNDLPDRKLPQNLEAERAVLGAVLLHNEALHEVDRLKPGHFMRVSHQRIYASMLRLSEASTAIDLVTLKEDLTRAGDLEECGGPAYIAALVDGVPRAVNVEHYARILIEKATLREAIFGATKLLAAAYDAEDDASTVIAQAERLMSDLGAEAAKGGFVAVRDVMAGVLERLEHIQQSGTAVSGVASGFADLDEMTRGFQPGDIVLVAGRPSMGKTAFAINAAEYASHPRQGKSVAVFSLEMSKEQLVMRSLASVGRIDGHRMQSGYLGQREWARLSQAMTVLSDARLHIDETAQITVTEMRAKTRRLQAEQGLDLVVIDYVQLMDASGDRKARPENRTVELGAISRGLKALAKELRVPVIVLSQLSRQPEMRADHRPILSDLRESGALEQDADLVMFLYRDEYYHPDREDNRGVAECIIAKSRNGPIGTVKLRFTKEWTRFDNLDRTDSPEQLALGADA